MYPKLFHVDYSGELSYSESAGLYFSLVNLTFVVAEIAIIIFRGLFIFLGLLLFCGALFYGFYHLVENITPFSASVMGTIQDIVMKALLEVWLLCVHLTVFLMYLAILMTINVVTAVIVLFSFY